MTPHYNRLNETVLMMGHKICCSGEIWIFIPKLSLLPLRTWCTGEPLDMLVYDEYYNKANSYRQWRVTKITDVPFLMLIANIVAKSYL